MPKQMKSRVVRLRIYAVIVAVFMLVLAFLPKKTGGLPEIENKLLITVLGIDKQADGYFLSATAVMPQEGQDGAVKRLSIGATGDSVSNALEEIMIKMGKPLELGLCGLVIIGNSMDGESVVEHLNYLMSSGKIIPGAHLLYSPKCSAKETIEMSNNLSEATSNNLSELVEYNSTSNNVPTVTLIKFLSETASKSRASYMPCLEIKKKEQKGESQGGGEQNDSQKSGEKQGGEDSKTEIESISTLALFKDGQKVALFDKEQTEGYTWTDKLSVYGLITLNSLTVNSHDFGQIYCQLLRKKCTLSTSLDGQIPTAKIKIEATLGHEDSYKLNDAYRYYGVSGKEMEEAVSNGYSRQIAQQISHSVESMKEYDCDILGTVDSMYRHNFNEFRTLKNTVDLFKNTQFSYEVIIRFI
ncbi:MAG: hypothetical protein IJX06_02340 [Clostridia bacterium]|nr:hypothetical protein [Clostridia bacterium]